MPTIEIDAYVPSAYLVYLYLWRRTRDGESRLPRVKRQSITAVPGYAVLRPWVR